MDCIKQENCNPYWRQTNCMKLIDYDKTSLWKVAFRGLQNRSRNDYKSSLPLHNASLEVYTYACHICEVIVFGRQTGRRVVTQQLGARVSHFCRNAIEVFKQSENFNTV